MATEKQLAANRANALLSTGPRTYSGRQSSRLNALKHGLTAKSLVLAHESETDFNELVDGLVEALRPVGVLEAEHVNRIAQALWRMRRVPVFEAAYMNSRIEQEERKYTDDIVAQLCDERLNRDNVKSTGPVGRMVDAIISGPDILGRLSRYEKGLSNEVSKLLKELKTMQLARIDTE